VVFALLIGAPRPVSLAEAAEAAAVDGTGTFDKQNRLREPRSILKICSSFVTLSPSAPTQISSHDEKVLRFAHYSVQEYLVSERAPPTFRIDHSAAHVILANISLGYLLSVNGLVPEVEATLHSLPFLLYASQHWPLHASKCQQTGHLDINESIIRFYDIENEDNLRNSILVCDPEVIFNRPFSSATKFISRLYYASLFGFVEACKDILDKGADVNAQGGKWGNALQAASWGGGHESVVRLLLEWGADVNAEGGFCGNALQAASEGGHESVVRLLLERGADVNAEGVERQSIRRRSSQCITEGA
jgi:Ankyrin repeats (3 copies)